MLMWNCSSFNYDSMQISLIYIPYAVGMTSIIRNQCQHSIKATDPDTVAAYHTQSAINVDLVAAILIIFTIHLFEQQYYYSLVSKRSIIRVREAGEALTRYTCKRRVNNTMNGKLRIAVTSYSVISVERK